jgi:hypothetical protein
MRCDFCGSRFPYAECYSMKKSVWYYICKSCFKNVKESGTFGFYILTLLERISVSTGLMRLKWDIQSVLFKIDLKIRKKYYRELDELVLKILFEEEDE